MDHPEERRAVGDTVVARWEPAKEDKSGEAITGYKVPGGCLLDP